MDLIAWAMETNRAVYMIRMDCLVDVFEPLKTPFTVALKDASPSEEATVMVHTGDHFSSCIASPRIAKRSSSLAKDEKHLAHLKKAKHTSSNGGESY